MEAASTIAMIAGRLFLSLAARAVAIWNGVQSKLCPPSCFETLKMNIFIPLFSKSSQIGLHNKTNGKMVPSPKSAHYFFLKERDRDA